jgi:hypothetical protein
LAAFSRSSSSSAIFTTPFVKAMKGFYEPDKKCLPIVDLFIAGSGFLYIIEFPSSGATPSCSGDLMWFCYLKYDYPIIISGSTIS